MPVSTAMNGGMAVRGLTRVWNSPSTSPPRTFTAPISVIIEPPAAEPPVVSRSTTQNVRSRSGRPSSSKLRCDSQRGGAGGAGGAVLLMATTLEAATDNPPDAARTRLGPGPDTRRPRPVGAPRQTRGRSLVSTVDPAAVPGRRRAARAGAIRGDVVRPRPVTGSRHGCRGGDPDAVLRVGPRDDPAVPR